MSNLSEEESEESIGFWDTFNPYLEKGKEWYNSITFKHWFTFFVYLGFILLLILIYIYGNVQKTEENSLRGKSFNELKEELEKNTKQSNQYSWQVLLVTSILVSFLILLLANSCLPNGYQWLSSTLLLYISLYALSYYHQNTKVLSCQTRNKSIFQLLEPRTTISQDYQPSSTTSSSNLFI